MIRLILFLAVFCIDVRVRAEVQEPERCWTASVSASCAIHTGKGEKSKYVLPSGQLVLDQAATVVRLSESKFQLIAGQVWVRTEKPVVFSTEFGELSSESGEFWLSRTKSRVVGSSVTGILKLNPIAFDGAKKSEIEVGPGMENWLGKVDLHSRTAQVGVPTAIPLREHLTRWARLYDGGRKSFTGEVESFYENWEKAAQEAAEIHEELFVRKVASIKQEEARRVEAQKKVDSRNRQLIEMFKRKVFDP